MTALFRDVFSCLFIYTGFSLEFPLYHSHSNNETNSYLESNYPINIEFFVNNVWLTSSLSTMASINHYHSHKTFNARNAFSIAIKTTHFNAMSPIFATATRSFLIYKIVYELNVSICIVYSYIFQIDSQIYETDNNLLVFHTHSHTYTHFERHRNFCLVCMTIEMCHFINTRHSKAFFFIHLTQRLSILSAVNVHQ